MKRYGYFLAGLSILLFACTISATATPQVLNTVPPATNTPTATAAAPATPISQTNATCTGVTLFLDPALASGFNCQSVPEASGASLPYFAINPQYTEITLQGYPLADRLISPQINVFPVARYTQILPDQVNPRVAALQSLIGGAAPGTAELPFLPIENAVQQDYVHFQVIPFANGSGARFITQYAQFADPLNNHDMFYTFQGLTSDGKYWVSVTLPVSNPTLPADGQNPPNGQSWDDFGKNFTKYITSITAQLNAQPPESFSPTIPMLDALIASIRVQP
ncbi:MAG: hypothetical protein WCE68_01955 [Anaerolineales bacterium]